MESLQKLKSRRKAVKNIWQMTKAMELVAATKMRKSQVIALNTRPYAFKALELLEKVERLSYEKIGLAQKRPLTKTLVVVVSSDRGLIGAFNSLVFKTVEKFIDEDRENVSREHRYLYVAVGKKSVSFLTKSGFNIVKVFSGFDDFVLPEETEILASFIINGFNNMEWDRVVIISMHFRTALKQDPVIRQILPVDFMRIRETIKELVPEYGKYSNLKSLFEGKGSDEKEYVEYLFEPSPREVLDSLVPHLVKMQIYHLILEANASEHSARMAAMKSASDNAQNISYILALSYNKVRQSIITREVIEINATQSALSY